MATIPRSLSKIFIRLFVALGVATACIGVNVGTAAADEVPPIPAITDPIATEPVGDPVVDDIVVNDPLPCDDPSDVGCVVLTAPYPMGYLDLIQYEDGTLLAAVSVYAGEGQFGGLWVSLTIEGDATFSDGLTSISVYTDPGSGAASTPIYLVANSCDTLEFDVSASIEYGDSEIPLQGSPAHASFPPPTNCSSIASLDIALTPTNPGDVYANGVDSWTGIITLMAGDVPILDSASNLTITVYRPAGDIIAPTDVVSTSRITDNGDGTYTVLFTTTTPGWYQVSVVWGTLSADAYSMIFYGMAEPPSITEANSRFISGFSSPGATILVKGSFVYSLGTAEADDEGFWNMTTPEGTPSQTITANVVDQSGAILAYTSGWLDTEVPNPPRVDIANMTEVAGFAGAAEPFAPVYATFPNGIVISLFANEDGSYSIATPVDMIDGVASVVQHDIAGNESDPVLVDLVRSQPLVVTVQSAQVYAGGIQVVVGQNFQPGEEVSALLSTNDTVLAQGFADGTGTVTLSFTVPADTAAGILNVVLTGAQSGSVAASFEVLVPVQECWYVSYVKAVLRLWFWWL